jgi:hypothetical protein
MFDIQLEKILDFLRSGKYTPYVISKKTGISNSTLWTWIRGEKKPNKSSILLLQYVFASDLEGNERNCCEIEIIKQKKHSENICLLCKEKEKTIKSQEKTIEAQKETIEVQKKLIEMQEITNSKIKRDGDVESGVEDVGVADVG